MECLGQNKKIGPVTRQSQESRRAKIKEGIGVTVVIYLRIDMSPLIPFSVPLGTNSSIF